jgi:membrane protein implicated in regulation of membrane protease activity
MSDTQLLTIASSLVATLFAILVMMTGWLGNKFYGKLDEISKNLVQMAGELHQRINGIDRRLTVVETHCDNAHGRRNGDRE